MRFRAEDNQALRRLSIPLKYDDRQGAVTDAARARGISEFVPSEGHRRFTQLVLTGKGDSPAYYVDRDGAQKMANGTPFYVQKTTLNKARDNNQWIVGVGNDAGGSWQVALIEHHYQEGSEVPRRRWPHNAVRYHDLRRD